MGVTAMAERAKAPTRGEVVAPAGGTWDDERYIGADRKVNELRLQLSQVEREIDQEIDRHQRFRIATREVEMARALVDDRPMPRDVEPAADMKALEQRRRVLRHAVGLAEEERDRVAAAVSAEIIDAALPTYRELVDEHLEAAEAFVASGKRLQKFRRGLEDRGTALGVMQTVEVYNPDAFAELLREERSRHALFHGGD